MTDLQEIQMIEFEQPQGWVEIPLNEDGRFLDRLRKVIRSILITNSRARQRAEWKGLENSSSLYFRGKRGFFAAE